MDSLPLESHSQKEKNALVLARAYQVVQGIKGEAKRKDVSIEDAEQTRAEFVLNNIVLGNSLNLRYLP
jgi:hypothetical protein